MKELAETLLRLSNDATWRPYNAGQESNRRRIDAWAPGGRTKGAGHRKCKCRAVVVESIKGQRVVAGWRSDWRGARGCQMERAPMEVQKSGAARRNMGRHAPQGEAPDSGAQAHV